MIYNNINKHKQSLKSKQLEDRANTLLANFKKKNTKTLKLLKPSKMPKTYFDKVIFNKTIKQFNTFELELLSLIN